MAKLQIKEFLKIYAEATQFFESDMRSHAEKLKTGQTAVESYKARVNSSIDSAIEKVALYEEALKHYKDDDKNTLQTMKDNLKQQKALVSKFLKELVFHHLCRKPEQK